MKDRSERGIWGGKVPAIEYLATILFISFGVSGSLVLWWNRPIVFYSAIPGLFLTFYMLMEFVTRQQVLTERDYAFRLGLVLFPMTQIVSAILLHAFMPDQLFPIQAVWALMLLFYNSFRIKNQILIAFISSMALFSLFYAALHSTDFIQLVIFGFITSGIIIISLIQRRIIKEIAQDSQSKVLAVKQNMVVEIETVQREVIFKFSEIAESRSQETGNHVRRVAGYSEALARFCGIESKDAELLGVVSPMHDIGKMGIPERILGKPGALTDEERDIMQQHTVIGYDMLKDSARKVFTSAAIVAHQHHERFDGSGYPFGKKGNDIHLFGRITALADVFDALASDRCYKRAWEIERVLKLIESERGKHFDPQVVDAFFANLPVFLSIRERCSDLVTATEISSKCA